MSSSTYRQTWALLRRYVICLINSPISTLLRNALWPGIISGISIYMIFNLDPVILEQAILQVGGLLKLMVMFIIYSIGDRMVKDRATSMKTLMLSMGLRRTSYYLSNSICIMTTILPYIIIAAYLTIGYLIPETQCPTFVVVLIFTLIPFHAVGLVHFLTSFITSSSFSAIILAVLFLESAINRLIRLAMVEPLFPRELLILVQTFSPFAALNIFGDSYVINKNSGKIECVSRPESFDILISAPEWLTLIGSLVWTLFYFAFSRWFEEVCPWQSDSAVRDPCFCFKSTQTFGDDIEMTGQDSVSQSSGKYFEQRLNQNLDAGIGVKKLFKYFGFKPAVNDVSFTIYKGETTLLLGHNGAGKSTLMNMILGLLQPSQGQISIKDYKTRGRSGIGLCPQDSILDADLSVKQHLELFTDLKSSLRGQERETHINKTLQDVGLSSHANKKPSELSGGMKRKLSLGIAFIGKSDILILDEPSSGLDPDSRVSVWNAIRRYRNDRTVLLSTQHMEEADYLGDRIAIMSAGRIVCCGSSLFLTRIFGTGYKLRVECKVSKRQTILDCIKRYFDTAEAIDIDDSSNTRQHEDSVSDFVIELRTSRDAEMELIKLMEKFEMDGESLGVVSYGLKSSSIEDVMLNTSKYFTQDNEAITLRSKEDHISNLVNSGRAKSRSGFMSHLDALIRKFFWTSFNDWKLWIIFRLGIPIFASYLWVRAPADTSATPNVLTCLFVFHLIEYPVRERSTKFKAIQLNSLLNVTTYWLGLLVCDIATMMINLAVLNIFIETIGVQSPWRVEKDLHSVMSASLITYSLAAMAFAYFLSMIIGDPRSAIGIHVLIYASGSLAGTLGLLIDLVMRNLDTPVRRYIGYVSTVLLPGDAFSRIQYGFYELGYVTKKFQDFDIGPPVESKSNLMYGFLALGFQILLYTCLLIFTEWKNIDLRYYVNLKNTYRLCCGTEEKRNHFEQDNDVVEERQRAITEIDQVPKFNRLRNNSREISPQQTPLTYSLIVANLSKSYIRGLKVVQNLSFTVRASECFGLLGVNGAGKTTTFSMVAAECKPDTGHIWANGYFVSDNVNLYRQHLGYDPQASPDLLLTPYQALYLIARLRGLQSSYIPSLIDSLLELLEMSQHKHKLTAQLSGGTKRKLALAMSLIGTPQLLALDEPTAGVDPVARRSIWQLLKSLRRKNNASIVISSHAMEECEAICDRISIMARGQLRCIGTFLHLRSKFAQGCSLRIQLASVTTATLASSEGSGGGHQDENIDSIVDQLEQQLATSIGRSVFKLEDKNVNSATFNIIDNRVRRSILFRVMREFRQKHSGLSYMINDSSLEDIFISLAREQQELEAETSPNREL